jgi:anthranilate/para-aminobenzoate synthase component I
MKCSLIHCSKIALSDWSSSRIVEALSVQSRAIFLSERSGSRDIQWLFLDCVGGVYLRKPPEVDRLNQDCRSVSGISPSDFFRLVDEVAEKFLEPIPFVSGYMSYEALMHHHRALAPSRPDGILGWYGIFETIIRISGEEVLEYKLSFTEIGEEWLSKGEKVIRSNYGKAPISRALLRDEIQASLRSENPIQSLTHLLNNIPSASRVPYGERILGIQELIRSGDVYQANLSLHLKVEGELDPLSTAQWLLGGGRAAQMAMMSFDKRIIASGSPEHFLRGE